MKHVFVAGILVGLASVTAGRGEQDTAELRGPLSLVKPGFGEGLSRPSVLFSLGCEDNLLWVLISLP